MSCKAVCTKPCSCCLTDQYIPFMVVKYMIQNYINEVEKRNLRLYGNFWHAQVYYEPLLMVHYSGGGRLLGKLDFQFGTLKFKCFNLKFKWREFLDAFLHTI